MSYPFVSVIVPCRNEAAFIEASVRSILASEYAGPFEVVVADGASSDGSRELLDAIARSDHRLRVVDNPDCVTPSGLNRAIAAAQGEIIARFDGHAVMPASYLRQTVDLLISSGAGNAGGAIRTIARDQSFFAEAIAAALSSRFGVGGSAFRTGAGETGPRPADTVFAGCWRREVFARIGGFNERLRRGQDMEFNLRLRQTGASIVLDPSIVCDYYARSSLASFWKHNFSNGVWAVLPFALSDIVPVRARHLIPLAFVLSLIFSALLPWPWTFLVAALYAPANLCASAHRAILARKARLLVSLPLVFLSLHLAYGLGSLWGAVLCGLQPLETGNTKHASRTET